jgi:hypothetical protein
MGKGGKEGARGRDERDGKKGEGVEKGKSYWAPLCGNPGFALIN